MITGSESPQDAMLMFPVDNDSLVTDYLNDWYLNTRNDSIHTDDIFPLFQEENQSLSITRQ